jgi:transcriptional regulator with XRE-family HTH domain
MGGKPNKARTNTREGYEIVRRIRLIEARERFGLTRPALADKLGVGRQYVFRVEEGLRRPSLHTMMRWAGFLRCSLDCFSDDVSKAAEGEADQPTQSAA